MTNALRWIMVVLLTGHGLIHLLGAAKGFSWADVEQLRQPIGTSTAVLWLLASVLVLTAALASCRTTAPEFDLLLRGGLVIDGTGTPALRADVGMKGDRIAAIGDLAEAASRLCALLHLAAAAEQPRIAVAPIPNGGIGAAINDRLRRAAA